MTSPVGQTHRNHEGNRSTETKPPMAETYGNAALYVLSGCSQPIITTLCKDAGIADPVCQLYLFFYSLGPALVIIPLLIEGVTWPPMKTILKALGITLFDVVATAMNYFGASLAGPTIFAIVYSSVTVWTAIFSQLLLGRVMNRAQWMSVVIVFGGLVMTANDSMQLGDNVVHGLFLIIFGSAMHSLTYVFSEAIMTYTDEKLTVRQNCAVQSGGAAIALFLWQIVYTVPRIEEKIWQPMQASGTTIRHALAILLLFAFSNLIHAITFFHTLCHFPGGSTSAGVMKGLQAVLVFVFTHFAFCGRTGGAEMCFTEAKFVSLVTVVGGVMAYGVATQKQKEGGISHGKQRKGYEPIEDATKVEHLPLSQNS